MKFKKSLALLLVFAMSFAPVMVSAAELSEDETELEILGEDAAYVEDEVEEDEINLDVGAKYWLHTASWEKPLEDQQATVGNEVKLTVKMKDVAEKQVTVSDPDQVWEKGKAQYLWTEASGNKYNYCWEVVPPEGESEWGDDLDKGWESSYNFTPKKTGAYKVKVMVNPALNNGMSTGADLLVSSAVITVKEAGPDPKPEPEVKKVTKITLTPSKYVGKKNETFKIKIKITPKDATNQKVEWKSSDNNVATVDKDGKVKIVGKSGKATITATAQDGSKVKGTCTVRVGTKVKKVKISAKDTKVKVGKTLKLSATVTPDNATEKGVTWKSSNKNIATVTSNGVVKGIKAGTVKITATAKDGSGKSASVTIKVEKGKVKVKKIRLNKTSKTLKSKDTYKFVATIEPSNATNKKLKWTSSNKNIASVDKNGKVTAHKTGKVTITATATDGSNVSAKATVKVPGLKLEPNKVSVKAGKSVVVKIKTTYDSVKSLTAEGESAYAALDKGGKTITVYGVKKGTTKIKVKTKAGIVKTLTVEVTGKSKTGSKIK